jgi:hypothetical protein
MEDWLMPNASVMMKVKRFEFVVGFFSFDVWRQHQLR